jgi:hypothetical protein
VPNFDAATFDRSAASFDNPDHIAIVIHNFGRGTVASRFPRLFTETKSAFLSDAGTFDGWLV